MAKVSEIAGKKQLYNQLLSQLTSSLPSFESRIVVLSACFVPGGAIPSELLDRLEVMSTETTKYAENINELASYGDELMAILAELDCDDTPKARELRANVDSLRARHTAVQSTIVEKRASLQKAVTRWKAARAELISNLDWIELTEARCQMLTRKASLDGCVLTSQIDAHRGLTSDVEVSRARLDAIVERCANAGVTERVDELSERYRILFSHVSDWGLKLDAIFCRLSTVNVTVDRLREWLADASRRLDGCRRTADLDDFSHARIARQLELDEIRHIGKELISDTVTQDKHLLRELLSDIQSQWNAVTQLYAKVLSSAVSFF